MKMKVVVIALLIVIVIVVTITQLYEFLNNKTIRVSTTTSLYATGLLERLAEEFRKQHPNIVIQFIAVGSGAALELASKGDVDMVFVHAPSLEQKFINEEVLVEGHIIAYNYFVIVGPKDDPAKIRDLSNPIEAFKRIYQAGEEGRAFFISRGDNSGTHIRELAIWRKTGLNPKGLEWYIESGTGMSKTLLIANEKEAYTLSDIGTFLKLKNEDRLGELELLISGSKELMNIYSAYIVNPRKYNTNYDLAKLFLEFVISDKGQEVIGKYGKEEFGQSLFYPAKGKEDELKVYWKKLTEY